MHNNFDDVFFIDPYTGGPEHAAKSNSSKQPVKSTVHQTLRNHVFSTYKDKNSCEHSEKKLHPSTLGASPHYFEAENSHVKATEKVVIIGQRGVPTTISRDKLENLRITSNSRVPSKSFMDLFDTENGNIGHSQPNTRYDFDGVIPESDNDSDSEDDAESKQKSPLLGSQVKPGALATHIIGGHRSSRGALSDKTNESHINYSPLNTNPAGKSRADDIPPSQNYDRNHSDAKMDSPIILDIPPFNANNENLVEPANRAKRMKKTPTPIPPEGLRRSARNKSPSPQLSNNTSSKQSNNQNCPSKPSKPCHTLNIPAVTAQQTSNCTNGSARQNKKCDEEASKSHKNGIQQKQHREYEDD